MQWYGNYYIHGGKPFNYLICLKLTFPEIPTDTLHLGVIFEVLVTPRFPSALLSRFTLLKFIRNEFMRALINFSLGLLVPSVMNF